MSANSPISHPVIRATWLATSLVPAWTALIDPDSPVAAALLTSSATAIAGYFCNRLTSKDDQGASARETLNSAIKNHKLAEVAAEAVKLGVLSFHHPQFPDERKEILAEACEACWLEMQASYDWKLDAYQDGELVARLVEHLTNEHPQPAVTREFWKTFLRRCAAREATTRPLVDWFDWDLLAEHLHEKYSSYLYNAFASQDSAGYRGMVLRLLCDLTHEVAQLAQSGPMETRLRFTQRFQQAHAEILEEARQLRQWLGALDPKLQAVLVRTETTASLLAELKSLLHEQGVRQKNQGAKLDEILNQQKELADLVRKMAEDTRAKVAARAEHSVANAGALRPTGTAKRHSDRSVLIDRIHRYWLEGVLHQTLTEVSQFEIGFQSAPQAILHHIDFGQHSLPDHLSIGQTFQKVGSELLILGAPGSGKTTMLLQLAEHLLAEASEDPKQPVPLVLPLNSWRPHESIAAWIVREAARSYQLPGEMIQRWLDDGRILPLLDGLDEVKENPQRCLEEINEFRNRRLRTGLAITSRTGDYGTLSSKLDVRAAITLLPLDEENVYEVLAKPELASLRSLIQTESWLPEMTRTPFLLNAMSYAYAGKSFSEIVLPGDQFTALGRKTHIFDTYVAKRLHETAGRGPYSSNYLFSQLVWLSANMLQDRLTFFHIEDLQKDWLQHFRARIVYCMATRVGFSILVVLPLTLVLGISTLVFPEMLPKTGAIGALLTGQMYGFLLLFSIFLFGAYTSVWREWGLTSHGLGFKPSARLALEAFVVSAGSILALYLPLVALVILGGANPWEWMSLTAITTTHFPVSFACLMTALIFRALNARNPASFTLVAASILCVIESIRAFYFPNQNFALSEPKFIITLPLAITVLSLTAIFGDDVKTAERVQWRWSKTAGIISVIVVQLIILPFVLYTLSTQTSPSLFQCAMVALIACALAAVVGGVIGCVFGFHRADTERTTRVAPNEGIARSISSSTKLAVGLGAGSFLILFVGYLVINANAAQSSANLSRAMVFLASVGVSFGVFGLVIGGLDVPVKHYVLRALLALSEKRPLRWVRFLDACKSHLLMRQTGGGYSPAHRELLEHLARKHQQPSRSV
ncbi:NACHT domain-containing protein [Oleiharenicola lentus]|uniref:NACHT domain-containing protein n=1 Tax=Oleiharenicola lentus TaxID=2508720 RepID=UPI003F6688A9